LEEVLDLFEKNGVKTEIQEERNPGQKIDLPFSIELRPEQRDAVRQLLNSDDGLTMPISWRGTRQQYVGRLHRLHENKKEVLVYDYADMLVPMLARMFTKRLAGYSALGYVVADGPTA
jgi:superfamily II DNA or RNA helicase